MPRTGRPATPVEVKRKRGTLRPDRMGGSTALATVPAVQLEADEVAPLESFERIIEIARAWLAQSDLLAVAMLRESLEERADLRDAVLAGHGDRRALRELDKQIVSQLSALGFDPAARSRLGLAEVRAASKLDEIRARRQDR